LGNATEDKGDREQVAGLAKGLAVIEAFGQHGDWLTLSEVARLTGLTPASARRCLRTLESLGYATSDGRYFNIAPRALRLGHAYLASNALPKVAQQAVEHLTEVTQDAASVGVLDGTDVVFVADAVGRRTLARGLGTGARLPAYCSAMGRVLLADWKDDDVVGLLKASSLRKLTPHTRDTVDAVLDEVRAARAQGYAIVDGELELGSRSIAVPIRTKRLAPPAAISLAVRGSELSVEALVGRCVPLLEGASGRMAALG
jgi:IclR family pca regulon transcriptional regulator